jgi:hypothetical protein
MAVDNKSEENALKALIKLKQLALEISKDTSKWENASLAELRKKQLELNRLILAAGDGSKTAAKKILVGNKDVAKSMGFLAQSMDKFNKTEGTFQSNMLKGLKDIPGMAAGVATGVLIAAKAGSKAMEMYGNTYNAIYKPMQEIAATATEQFGAATDAQGKYTKTMSGDIVSAQIKLRDVVAGNVKGIHATKPVLRAFSADTAKALEQLEEHHKDFTKNFNDELASMDTGLRDPARVENLIGFQKVLGATGEDMGTLAGRARIMGTTIEAQAAVATEASRKFGKAFGVSGKFVAIAMNELRKDFKNFGTFSEEQLAKVAATTRKLGVSISGVTGLADKFDDFDSAAEKVAMLGQSFGINVDAFDLFAAEDPTERLKMIQEAAAQAGVDIASMSRVEMKHLSDLTGMGVEDTMKALGQAGQNIRSQLGEGPEVKTPADQQQQLIEVQQRLAGVLETFKMDIAAYPDTAEALAKAPAELFAFAKGGLSRMGIATGETFNAIVSSGVEASTSAAAAKISQSFQSSAIAMMKAGTASAAAMIDALSHMATKIDAQKAAGKAVDKVFLEKLAKSDFIAKKMAIPATQAQKFGASQIEALKGAAKIAKEALETAPIPALVPLPKPTAADAAKATPLKSSSAAAAVATPEALAAAGTSVPAIPGAMRAAKPAISATWTYGDQQVAIANRLASSAAQNQPTVAKPTSGTVNRKSLQATADVKVETTPDGKLRAAGGAQTVSAGPVELKLTVNLNADTLQLATAVIGQSVPIGGNQGTIKDAINRGTKAAAAAGV